MSGPFRELFVELGRELFDTVKALGEAAVVEAQQRKVAAPPIALRSPLAVMLDAATAGAVMRALSERYGWRDIVGWSRLAYDLAIELRVRLACGHRHAIAIGEIELHRRANMFEALLDALDRRAQERSCYCAPRDRA